MFVFAFRRSWSRVVLVEAQNVIPQFGGCSRKVVRRQFIDELHIGFVRHFVHSCNRSLSYIEVQVGRPRLLGALGYQQSPIPVECGVEAIHEQFLSLWRRSAKTQRFEWSDFWK